MAGPILARADQKYTTVYNGAATDYSAISGTRAAKDFGYDLKGALILQGMFPDPFKDEAGIASKVKSILNTTGEIVFDYRLRASQITDGLSHTFMLVEDAGRPERWQMQIHTGSEEPLFSAWADPKTVIMVDGVSTPNGKCLLQCDNNSEIYSFHANGANALFADGHVQYLEETIDPKLIIAFISPDAGDSVEEK